MVLMNKQIKKPRKINGDMELFGLLKVPDQVLLEEAKKEISELKTEIGKLNSYIMELEHELKTLKGEDDGILC